MLVNRIVDALTSTGMRVIVLQGNHDYLLDGRPFFAFLNEIEGVSFIHEPGRIGDWVFLPHSRKVPLPGLSLIDSSVTHCFMHQTVSGAVSSNGQRMEGELSDKLLPRPHTCKYYSGDIHVPQYCGHVEYIGSPYPVHFGDKYSPRMIVLEDEEDTVDIPWEGIKRATVVIEGTDDLDDDLGHLKHEDQVKVRLRLHASELAEWHEHKRAVQVWCDKHGVRLMAVELLKPAVRRQLVDHDAPPRRLLVSREDVLDRYAKQMATPAEALEVARMFLRRSEA